MAPRRKNVDTSDLKAAVRKAKAKEKVTLEENDVRKLMCVGSFRDYKVITTAWKEFVELCLEEDDEDRHFPFQWLPSVETVEVFLAYLVRTSPRPILGGNISSITLKNRLSHLKRAIKLHTDAEFSKEQNKTLNEAIKKRLPVSEGVCQKAKEKPVASFDVIEGLIRFAWTCDEHQFSHPRVRLQLMFAIILFAFLGTRPGEIVETDSWRGSNTGLVYEDIQLHRQVTSEYCGLLLHLKLMCMIPATLLVSARN